jgi:hypothetical protein
LSLAFGFCDSLFSILPFRVNSGTSLGIVATRSDDLQYGDKQSDILADDFELFKILLYKNIKGQFTIALDMANLSIIVKYLLPLIV